jgi:multidrug efflux pump subunit AcrA (membrane-fusion protein)
MKCIERPLISALVLTVTLVFSGCSPKDGDARNDATRADQTESGVSFRANHGLLVQPATANFIGLKVAEVEERKVAFTVQFSAQIYRAANEAEFISTRPSTAATALASAWVGASEAALLRGGLSVTIDADGTEKLRGQIVGLNRDLEKAAGQIELLLVISDEKGRLTKGAFVSATVPLGGEKSVVSVPRSSLFRTTEGDFVYTVSGERFVRTAVKLGSVNHDFAEVADGLYAGDQIVVTPVMTLWLAELQSLRGGKACGDGQ